MRGDVPPPRLSPARPRGSDSEQGARRAAGQSRHLSPAGEGGRRRAGLGSARLGSAGCSGAGGCGAQAAVEGKALTPPWSIPVNARGKGRRSRWKRPLRGRPRWAPVGTALRGGGGGNPGRLRGGLGLGARECQPLNCPTGRGTGG